MKDQQAKQQQQAAAAAAAQQQQQQEPRHESIDKKEESHEEPQEEQEQEEDEEEEVNDEESEEEEESEDEDLEELYQALIGKKVNKSGMVVDKKSGAILGRLVEGKAKRVAGKKVSENGEVYNDKGKLVGRVEPIQPESSSEEDNESNLEGDDDADEFNAQNEEESAPTEDAPQDDDLEKAKEVIEQDKKKAEDAKGDADDTTEEATEDVKNNAKDTTEEATEDAKDTAEEATEDVKNATEDAKDDAEEATEDVKDGSKDTAEDVEDTTEEATDKTRDIKEESDNLENEVEDLEVGKDNLEDDAKAGAAAAAGGAAGALSKDKSEDDEEKPQVDEDSPVVKKSGKVLDMDDNLVGHVDKRMAPKLAGFKVDSEGNVINNEGEIVGLAEMIKTEEVEEEKPFNPNEMVDENSPEVKKSGKVVDMEDNIVGSVEKRLAAKLAGFKVDQNGNVINHDGHIVAKADMIKTEEPEEEDKPFNPNDMVNEDSPEVRKSGKVVDMEDNIVGHVDKRIAPKLAGLKVDEEGNVINNEGHIVGKAELIKTEEEPKEEEPKEEENKEEENKPFNPNEDVDEDSPEVRKSGKIVDNEDNIVGSIDKRLAAKHVGCKVDSEGNVINSEGHIVARAEMFPTEEEPKEEEPKEEENKPFNPNEMVDEDSPEVKKSGKVVDMEDNIIGSVDKRVASKYAGCKVDPEGNVINGEGHIVARAEIFKTEEEPKEDENKPFNPYAMVDENSPEVKKSGKVLDMDDNLVGHVDKRIASKLAGCKVDSDGNIINSEGHIAGKADMIKEEESESEEEDDKDKPFNPNTSVNEHSPEVRRSGKVVDEDDNIVGHVDKNAAHKLAGFKVDHDGNIINDEGHIVGKAEMIKQKSEEERKRDAEDEEYRRIADQMSASIQHSLDKIKPVLKNITDTIEAEEAKSEQDRDEEKLVETVKPLIEQGSNILNEANGAIRGLDPSGKIAKTAQGRTAERKALPEEYHLAELLSQLTGEVSTTIDKAKKKVKNMPHAKKALSPLWNILQSPLLQILSAVGLLLTGVLGIVGQLLNGLGLGGIINSLLGGIGLNKILEGFGLGNALNLAGRKK